MPEKKVKTALIGLGRWGSRVAKELAAQSDFVAVSARNQRTPDELGLRGVPYRSVEDLCADSDIEAVWIATPINTHREVAQKVISAGKHVVLEKPAGTSAADAELLAEEAKKHNVLFATGYVFLYHPAYRWLKEHLDPKTLSSVSCVWKKTGTFIEPIELNLVTHHLSIALDLMGEPTGGTLRKGGATESACDAITTTLTYPSCTFESVIDRRGGTEHTLRFSCTDGSTYVWDGTTVTHRANDRTTIVFETSHTALSKEVEAFLAAVQHKNGHSLPSSGPFGAQVLQLKERLRVIP